jgi:hypothetical protein
MLYLNQTSFSQIDTWNGTHGLLCYFIFSEDFLLPGVCVLLGAIVTDYTEENISIRFVNMVSHIIQCCGTITIFYGSGPDFWQIPGNFGKKSCLFSFYISLFTRKKICRFHQIYRKMWTKKMLRRRKLITQFFTVSVRLMFRFRFRFRNTDVIIPPFFVP